MKLSINVGETLTVETPFGTVEMIVGEHGVELTHDTIEIPASVQQSFLSIQSKAYQLDEEKRLNTLQIVEPCDRDDICYIVHEGKQARSEAIAIDALFEYTDVEQYNEIDYALLEEFVFENGIVLEEGALSDLNDDYLQKTFY